MEMTLEAAKNEIIREILDVNNIEILNKIKNLLHREGKQINVVAEEQLPYLTKAEVLAGFDDACKEIKQAAEGKLKGIPLNEFLNEL